MAENPKVHSKGETYHGKPHTPGKVASPGATAPNRGSHGTSHSQTPREHTATHYHPNEHGRMDQGGHADHPTHGKKTDG